MSLGETSELDVIKLIIALHEDKYELMHEQTQRNNMIIVPTSLSCRLHVIKIDGYVSID